MLSMAVLAGTVHAHDLDAHPLHTTMTEIVDNPARGTVRATVRVFMDDLSTVIGKRTHGRVTPASGAAWDAASQTYMKSVFSLSDKDGHTLPLQSCGVKRTADLLWFCLEAARPDVASIRVSANVLCDLYDDQINVVQATVGGARKSLLFTKGDKAKPLS